MVIDTSNNRSTAATTTATTAAPDTTAPGPVTSLAHGTPTSTTVPLTWALSPAGDVATQEVAYSADSTNFTVASAAVNASSTAYTVTGLTANTAYTFRVVAVDGAGNRSTAVTTTATTAASGGKVDDASLILYQDNPTTNQIISNKDNYFHHGDQFTAFVTMKPAPLSNSATQFFSRQSPNAINFELSWDNKFHGLLTGKGTSGTGSASFPDANSAGYYDHGTTYHIAIVRNSTNLKLYVNNVLKHNLTVASDFWVDDSTSDLYFGKTVAAGATLYNMGYYNRALSDAELTQNFNFFLPTADTTAPNPVTADTAGTLTTTTIPITWTASGVFDAHSYKVAYSTDGTNFTVASGTVLGNATAYTITGLTANTAF